MTAVVSTLDRSSKDGQLFAAELLKSNFFKDLTQFGAQLARDSSSEASRECLRKVLLFLEISEAELV